MVKLDQILHEITLVEGVSATIDEASLYLNGPNGSTSREFTHTKVNLSLEGDNVVVQ
jgi:ribosomal protein L6P/L9E